ncbi:MAG: STAS/SEC14 domain-containing protein [Methylophilaceae bacterium]|nr:STAS/SEC14 domain-containing protein [Methylophilaceae bacterium]
MISITTHNNLVSAAVLGNFTLADFREFEEHVRYVLRFNGKANLLIDLRDMVSQTLDVALEELRFTRNHPEAFEKIAIVTENPWQQWEALLSNLFVNATIEAFSDEASAMAWLNQP